MCAAYIFLCAPFSSRAQQGAADSYAAEALRWEREIFLSSTPSEFNRALMQKVEVRKQQGLWSDAVAELGRVRTFALTDEELADYYYQRALCGYLAAEFEGSLAAIDEARLGLYDTTALARLDLIEALAAGEVGLWSRSEEAARRVVARIENQADREVAAERLAEIYDGAPKLRSLQLAWWLSLVPGVGQIYAGEVWSGVVSLAVNGGLVAFGVGEIVARHWLSAWLVGGGLLSNTYFVGQERARILTERRNTRVLRKHNDLLRAELLK